MQDFRALRVWQVAHENTLELYRSTGAFPYSERFGLTSQIRRCAVSVAANIAEGCGRQWGADESRFYQISLGSGSELRYLLLLARDLEYLTAEAFAALDDHVNSANKMLIRLLSAARKRGRKL